MDNETPCHPKDNQLAVEDVVPENLESSESQFSVIISCKKKLFFIIFSFFIISLQQIF